MRTERRPDQMRPIEIEQGYSPSAASVIYKVGRTMVHCSASLENKVPNFVEEGTGWVTAEYSMLPGATSSRMHRERGKVGGRTMEIQRLIGRSLRSVVDMKALGPRAIFVDCDVLSADGGTRCASISGAYVALNILLKGLEREGVLRVEDVITHGLAAISVGIVDGEALLDLEYTEDSTAEVDFNVIMTGNGHFVELQGTAERHPFSRTQLDTLLALGEQGVQTLLKHSHDFLQKLERQGAAS